MKNQGETHSKTKACKTTRKTQKETGKTEKGIPPILTLSSGRLYARLLAMKEVHAPSKRPPSPRLLL
jgi:hypothetical protein